MPDRNGEILCLFPNVSISVPCKLSIECVIVWYYPFFLFAGNDVHNIAIVPSELPLISDSILPQTVSFLISGFDSMDSRIRTTLQVELSKLPPEDVGQLF